MQRDNYAATKSMSYALGDGPANALALSKDNSNVVVAGRNVFKILAIEEDGFVEKVNLRVGKNLNLNYSCNDVTWSHLDENLIATGATNGAVVLWNLSKNTRAKQEHVFPNHQRTVHKVVFHPTDPSILLSGSQDGTVKHFDLRSKEARMTFTSNSESVRDVQFVPKNNNSFTSVSENGSVQLWDLRKGDRPYLTFTAHYGPVFSCDWHPDLPNVLATGGRDRAIKVWSVTNIASCDHTIQTVASVGRIKWRPQRKNHIGSTSLVVDASVCVWDVRRPFVPFAAFEKHKDVATGIAWKGSPHIFISTSKDCTLWQHVFRDASRPASKAIPQALALNIRRGELTQAVSTQQIEAASRFPMFKKTTSLDEQFHLAESKFFAFEVSKLVADSFQVECAAKYILWGKDVPEMCDNNVKVAMSLNLPRIAMTWELAKLFYLSTTAKETLSAKITGPVLVSSPKVDNDENVDSDDDLNNNSSSETEKQEFLTEIASGLHMTHSHSMFLQPGPTYDFQVQQDWQVLPAEAFQLRHPIKEGSSPPIHLEDCSPRDAEETVETVAIENRTSQLSITKMEPVPPIDFTEALLEALYYHAKLGDVQTAVCVWLVLSPVDKLPIDTKIMEMWCLGYVELLQRFRLYAQAALVIKHCKVIGHFSQQSTSFLVCCGKCGKPLNPRNGNYCEKCRKAAARCSVCHATVSGLMSWCQGCGHGGHIAHLQSWFTKHKECPEGCGHLCHS